MMNDKLVIILGLILSVLFFILVELILLGYYIRRDKSLIQIIKRYLKIDKG